ncbi:hypothetical protein CQA77_30025, partial [Klebsiella pneumoniae]
FSALKNIFSGAEEAKPAEVQVEKKAEEKPERQQERRKPRANNRRERTRRRNLQRAEEYLLWRRRGQTG